MRASLPIRALFGLACINILLLSSGCMGICCHMSKDTVSAISVPTDLRHEKVDGLRVLVFRPTGSNDGKVRPVLLLHEIVGMNSNLYGFANRLADNGFTVYVPVMFGSERENGALPVIFDSLYVFFSPDWPTVALGTTPLVVPRLRNLLQQIARDYPERPVGVIGQCITGSIPLALMTEPNVRIAAVCQPALPMIRLFASSGTDLELSCDDLNRAFSKIISDKKTVLGFRFESDCISTKGRFQTITDALTAEHFKDRTIKVSEYGAFYSGHPHSVFGEDYKGDAGSPTAERFKELVNDFKSELTSPLGSSAR